MKKIKLFSWLLIVAMIAPLIAGCGGGGGKDVLAEIKDAGKIVVSSDPNYAPQSFLNDQGELDGFDIDVAKEVGKRMGVEVEFVTPEWDLITSGNWSKRWDVSIGSMTPTANRKEVLYFTDPYYYTPAQFAVHVDNTDIQAIDDFAGKKIGVCSECTYELYLNKELQIEDTEIVYQDWEAGEVRTYPTDADAIQDLALGDGVRLDGVLSAKPTIFEAIQSGCENGCPMKMIGEPVYYEPLAFALDKSREPADELLAELNKVIASMHEDGTLTELSIKWYGVDITKKTS